MSDNIPHPESEIIDIIEPVAINELTNSLADTIAIRTFGEVIASVMNEAQFAIISGRTPKSAIKKRPGKGGKTFSYVPHGYVTSVLNRAFGFDWDFTLLPNGNGDYYQLIQGKKTMSGGREVNTPDSVVVVGQLTIRIHNPNNIAETIATITKSSTGEKEFVPGMTWGSLIKSAESDALKKAASRLGVALDLYWQDADEDYVDKQAIIVQPVEAVLPPNPIVDAVKLYLSEHAQAENAEIIANVQGATLPLVLKAKASK